MGLIRGSIKMGVSSKSGLGKVGISNSKTSIDDASEKKQKLQQQRYEKVYKKQRDEEIGKILNSLKTDFQADSVIKEGNIIKVKKGIQEYQFNIGNESINYVDKVLDIPEDMIKSGNTYTKNPLNYTSSYDNNGKRKKREEGTYIPYEVVLDDKGNLKSEIWRDTYESYDKRDDDRKIERRDVYVSQQKDYTDGNLISEKKWDDFTTVKKKDDDMRYEKRDVFLKNEKLYNIGNLIKERKWDDYRDHIDKYDKGYRYEYDTYLKKDVDYTTGLVTGDSPGRTKVTDYALMNKMENYEYKDPYIAILEKQKKSLTPEAQKRQDISITERKIKEINKEFGTSLKSPYVQINAPGVKSNFDPVKAQMSLDYVSYIGNKQPKNVKQLLYQTDIKKNPQIFNLQKKLDTFDKLSTVKLPTKKIVIPDRNLYGASLVTKAPLNESTNWFTRTKAKIKDKTSFTTPTFNMGGMGVNANTGMFNNNMFNQTKNNQIKQEEYIPELIKNNGQSKKKVFGVFSEQTKLDIMNKI
jgi:hypothetical protein